MQGYLLSCKSDGLFLNTVSFNKHNTFQWHTLDSGSALTQFTRKRMHSSRMRTVCWGGGVSAQGVVSAQRGCLSRGGWWCLPKGVSAWGCLPGECLPRGVSARGGVCPWGVYPGVSASEFKSTA